MRFREDTRLSTLQARLRREWAQYHPTVWLLTGGRLFNSIIQFMTMPFLMIYLNSLGIDLVLIGAIAMTGPIGSTLGSLIGGQLSDRHGRKGLMVIGLSLSGLATLGFAFATQTWQFAVLMATAGFFGSLYWPSSRAAVADLTPPERRNGAFGLWRISHNIGAAIGPLMGVLVSQRAVMFGVTGVAELLYTLVFLFLGVESLPPAARKAAAAVNRAAAWAKTRLEWGVILRDRPFLLYILAGIFGSISYRQMYGNYSLYLAAYLPDAAGTFSRIMSLNGFLVVFGQMAVTRYSERWSAGRQLVIGSLIYAVSYALFAIPAKDPFILAVTVLWTVGEMVFMTSQLTFVADIAPEHLRARYMGASSISWTIGELLSGPFGTLLLKHFGGAVMMLSASAVTFLAAAIFQASARLAAGAQVLVQAPVPVPAGPVVDQVADEAASSVSIRSVR